MFKTYPELGKIFEKEYAEYISSVPYTSESTNCNSLQMLSTKDAFIDDLPIIANLDLSVHYYNFNDFKADYFRLKYLIKYFKIPQKEERKKYDIFNPDHCSFQSIHCISNDFLAVGEQKGYLRILDYRFHELVSNTFLAHTASINMIKTIRMNTIATCSSDCLVRIWHLMDDFQCEINTLTPLRFIQPLKHNAIACVGEENYITVWNISPSKVLYCLLGHKQTISGILLLEDELLASSSVDGKVIVWSLAKRAALLEIDCKDKVNEILLIELQRNLIACVTALQIVIWDYKSNVCVTVLTPGIYQNYSLINLEYNIMASCDTENVITFWNMQDFKIIKRKKINNNKAIFKIVRLNKNIIAIAFNNPSSLEFFDYMKFLLK